MSVIAVLVCRKRGKKGSKPRTTLHMRMWAAFVYMMIEFGFVEKKKLPMLWEKWDGAEEFVIAHTTQQLTRLSNRWGRRFMQGGSMRDLPRRKKGRKIPLEEARRAAWYLKSGRWMVVPGTDHREAALVHRYYTSLDMACQHCPELMAIRQKYRVTNKEFYRAMHEADPKLARRRVRLRYELKEETMRDRQDRAAKLYERCTNDSTYLDRIYFIDECGIVIDNVLKKGVQVYIDAHDHGYKHVIHTENVHNGSRIKLHILAAVNAVHGAVYLEFTTGTTDIQREWNILAMDPEFGGYRVSARCWSLH